MNTLKTLFELVAFLLFPSEEDIRQYRYDLGYGEEEKG